jgi:hypothetical protein
MFGFIVHKQLQKLFMTIYQISHIIFNKKSTLLAHLFQQTGQLRLKTQICFQVLQVQINQFILLTNLI